MFSRDASSLFFTYTQPNVIRSHFKPTLNTTFSCLFHRKRSNKRDGENNNDIFNTMTLINILEGVFSVSTAATSMQLGEPFVFRLVHAG